jgi:hypothetical protein
MILSGPEGNSIMLKKKIELSGEIGDIQHLSLTSRSTSQSLELALCTEKGLYFYTLKLSQFGRSM